MIFLCLALYILASALTAIFIVVLQDRAPWTVGSAFLSVACVVLWPAFVVVVGLFLVVMWTMEKMA